MWEEGPASARVCFVNVFLYFVICFIRLIASLLFCLKVQQTTLWYKLGFIYFDINLSIMFHLFEKMSLRFRLTENFPKKNACFITVLNTEVLTIRIRTCLLFKYSLVKIFYFIWPTSRQHVFELFCLRVYNYIFSQKDFNFDICQQFMNIDYIV